ncbi:DUF192 domain-containing protein [Candidatus Woesearchaeota archaeon]|nr:DUF192 domain-containing protein [Candidatus Woesearchaeota archaeon]
MKNKEVIKIEGKVCKGEFSKARGLMFSRKKTLIFEFKEEIKVSLHMFFVFFPINVYFLNKNKEVVEIKEKFNPFTIYFPKNKAKYIVECPNKLNVKIKDKVDW